MHSVHHHHHQPHRWRYQDISYIHKRCLAFFLICSFIFFAKFVSFLFFSTQSSHFFQAFLFKCLREQMIT